MEERNAGHNRISMLNALLIMVAVFLVGAVIWPVLKPPHRDDGFKILCLSNLKQIGMAFSMYISDNDNTMPKLYTTDQQAPDGKSWPELITPYIKNRRVFQCPGEENLVYSINPEIAGQELVDVIRKNGENVYRDMSVPDGNKIAAVFDSVSDSPEKNNLNGNTIWQPSNGGHPKPGQLVLLPKRSKRITEDWPEWAKPNHETGTNVLYLDWHVMHIDISDDQPLMKVPARRP